MQRRTVLTAAASAAMAFALLGGCANYRDQGETPADVQGSIDTGVGPTLTALYAKVPGSKELADKARGILVFPSVFDGGAVVGGEYGRGALIVDGRTVGYYKTSSVSLGVQVGAQSRSLVLMFMTQDALDRLSANKGWTAGADASVALLHVGANGRLEGSDGAATVSAFALNNEGLMVGASIDGTKLTRIEW
jgi:lipid-binding SYLF domain-containing protein